MSETAIAGGLPAISVAQGIPSPSGAERDAGEGRRDHIRRVRAVIDRSEVFSRICGQRLRCGPDSCTNPLGCRDRTGGGMSGNESVQDMDAGLAAEVHQQTRR